MVTDRPIGISNIVIKTYNALLFISLADAIPYTYELTL